MKFAVNKNSIAEPSTYVDYIDGLRGVAILLVLAVHTAQKCFPFQHEFIYWKGIAYFPIGVQLFFIISAFTLYSSSRKRFEIDKYPKLSFYIRRFFRIWPIWFLATLIYAIYYHVSNQINITAYHFLSSSFFWGYASFLFGDVYPITPGGWSLFVEETFYLVLPFILMQINSIRKAILLILCLWIIGRIYLFFMTINLAHLTNDAISTVQLTQFPLAHWVCFGIGILIFLFLDRCNNFKAIIDFQAIKKLIVPAELFFFVFAIDLWGSKFSSMLLLISIFFLFASQPFTFSGWIARRPILKNLGGKCFSIYLFHILILDIFTPYLNICFKHFNLLMSGEIKFALYFPVVVFVSLGVSTLSFQLFEKPCVNFGKKIVSRLNLCK